MRETLKNIEQSGRSLAILIDPEKMKLDAVAAFAETIPTTILFLQKNLHIDQFFFLSVAAPWKTQILIDGLKN